MKHFEPSEQDEEICKNCNNIFFHCNCRSIKQDEMNQQQQIEDRAKELFPVVSGKLNGRNAIDIYFMDRMNYIKGATDQAAQSYSREEVDILLNELKQSLFPLNLYKGNQVIPSAIDRINILINEFTEKHKG